MTLSHEQEVALAHIRPGARILVTGAPGSGRSELAVEILRRGGAVVCASPAARSLILERCVARGVRGEGAVFTAAGLAAGWLAASPGLAGRRAGPVPLGNQRISDLRERLKGTEGFSEDMVNRIVAGYRDIKLTLGLTMAPPHANRRQVEREMRKHVPPGTSLAAVSRFCQAYEAELEYAGQVDEGDLLHMPGRGLKHGLSPPALDWPCVVLDDAHLVPASLYLPLLAATPGCLVFTAPDAAVDLKPSTPLMKLIKQKHFVCAELGASLRLGWEYLERLRSHRQRGARGARETTVFQFCDHENGAEMFAKVGQAVTGQLADGVLPHRIGVTFAAAGLAQDLAEALRDVGVPTRWQRSAGPSSSARTLTALLRFAADPTDVEALEALHYLVPRGQSQEWRTTVCAAAQRGMAVPRIASPQLAPHAEAVFATVEGVRANGLRNALQAVRDAFPALDDWDLVELEDYTLHLTELIGTQSLHEPRVALALSLLFRGLVAPPPGRRLVQLVSADNLEGMDLDVLHIVGYSDGLFTHPTSDPAEDRARSVLCLTRASRLCVAHHAAKIKWPASPRPASYTPCYFLAELGIEHPAIRMPRDGMNEGHDRFSMSMR